MMPNFIMCWIARYTIGNDSNHRNITQPNRWWGFCLLLHTTINYNIYIMYLLMQMGSKLGCYIPLPLGITQSSVFQYLGIHIQFTHPKFPKFHWPCSISFESSCLEHFLMDRLDECPIIDPLFFPLWIAPRRIFTSCKQIESCKI